MNTANPPVLDRNLPDEQHLAPPGGSATVKINLARIANALSTETIAAPKGMSKEETRQFIINQAKSQ